MKQLLLACLPVALLANAEPEPVEQTDASTAEQSEFVGRYDGGSFEMAMGMEVLADGTWGWGLSVGALDMRARGTWRQEGAFIVLTSDPKPVAPEFRWSRIEEFEGAPFVRLVWGSNGEPFQYGDAVVTCANGKRFWGQVRNDGFPSLAELEYTEAPPEDRDPRKSCDVPETMVLKQSIHDVESEVFNLSELGWEPGKTAVFEFHPNDLGVADFTGVTGYLKDGKIVLDLRPVGRADMAGPLEMRKIPGE